jgi:hypothetical protein
MGLNIITKNYKTWINPEKEIVTYLERGNILSSNTPKEFSRPDPAKHGYE